MVSISIGGVTCDEIDDDQVAHWPWSIIVVVKTLRNGNDGLEVGGNYCWRW